MIKAALMLGRLRRMRFPWSSWFDGKDFTVDHVSHHILVWRKVLAEQVRGTIRDVLEVGAYEGSSAVFWLNYLPESRLVAIDTFSNADRSRRFDANLAEFGDRVTKMACWSRDGLAYLVSTGASFDLIYVDGSHRRDDVMIDCLLSWQLLRSGGYMILDDYRLDETAPSAQRPGEAIDAFLGWHRDEMEVLVRGWQVILRRLDGHHGAPAGSALAG